MTSRDFCYWLQGFYEILGGDPIISANQSNIIRRHLNLVFRHEIDPSIPDLTGELQAIHDGKPPFNSKPLPFQGDGLVRC